jgi:hypothetical protein
MKLREHLAKTFQRCLTFEDGTAIRNQALFLKEATMLFFYLPFIIFDAMIPGPRRNGEERDASTRETDRKAAGS